MDTHSGEVIPLFSILPLFSIEITDEWKEYVPLGENSSLQETTPICEELCRVGKQTGRHISWPSL